MALAPSITLNFIDQKGKTSSTEMHIPTGFSFAQMVEFAQAAAQLYADLSIGQITSVSLNVPLSLVGATIKAVAAAASDINQKAQFVWNTAVTGFRKLFRLPAFKETLIVAGSDQVNIVNADVASFISGFEDGYAVTGGTVEPCDGRLNDIDTLLSNREFFRGS